MNEEIFSYVVLFTSFGQEQESLLDGSLNIDQTQYSGLNLEQIKWAWSGFFKSEYILKMIVQPSSVQTFLQKGPDVFNEWMKRFISRNQGNNT